MNKVGDIVKVVDKDSYFFGQLGKITSIDYTKINLKMDSEIFAMNIESSRVEKIDTKSTTLFKLRHSYV